MTSQKNRKSRKMLVLSALSGTVYSSKKSWKTQINDFQIVTDRSCHRLRGCGSCSSSGFLFLKQISRPTWVHPSLQLWQAKAGGSDPCLLIWTRIPGKPQTQNPNPKQESNHRSNIFNRGERKLDTDRSKLSYSLVFLNTFLIYLILLVYY
jgi:hypothetical protein